MATATAWRWSDNLRVLRAKDHQQFFAVGFHEPDEVVPSTVTLWRYQCPGRFDVYDFDYVHGSSGIGDRVRFFTDVGMGLIPAARMLAGDLNKKSIVNMLVDACKVPQHRPFVRDLTYELIGSIAPKSMAFTYLDRLCKDMFAPKQHG